ncbi:MAG: hypothetical protein JNM72_20320 [Deltaproteobacteria bacterium]|nr:hypothetical protein [Deltaproteobacteria bacterium]
MRIISQLLPTALLWGAAAYVWSTNAAAVASGRGPVLAFPFLGALFPRLDGDPQAMGKASAALLVALGGITLLRAILRIRAARER